MSENTENQNLKHEHRNNSISQLTELSTDFAAKKMAIDELRGLLQAFQTNSNALLEFINNPANDDLTTALAPEPSSNFALVSESVETIEYYLNNSLYDLQEIENETKKEYADKMKELL